MAPSFPLGQQARHAAIQIRYIDDTIVLRTLGNKFIDVAVLISEWLVGIVPGMGAGEMSGG